MTGLIISQLSMRALLISQILVLVWVDMVEVQVSLNSPGFLYYRLSYFLLSDYPLPEDQSSSSHAQTGIIL